MKLGDRFNPNRAFPSGMWIPDCIVESRILQPTDKLVLGRLMRSAGEKGWCWPSRETLAAWTGLSLKQVRLALGRLVSAGVIEVELQPGRSSGYYFRWHQVYKTNKPGPPGGPTVPTLPGPPEGPAGGPPGGQQAALSGPLNVEGNVKGNVAATQRDLPLKPVGSEQECGDCGGTGWRQRAMAGVSAVERCTTCRRGVIQKKPQEKAFG